jgi:DUF4097 and DUF4098 domain-containing protein YvlB
MAISRRTIAMTSKLLFSTVLGLALLTVGCDDMDFGMERHEAPFHYTLDMKPGARLELETFNGSVEIRGWDQNKVDVSGTKYANSEALRDAIRIDAHTTSDGAAIRAIRPSEHHGNMGAKFVIQVPHNVRLDRVTTSNGAIRVEATEGPVMLRTSNGAIHLSDVNGSLDLGTSNGGIDVEGTAGRAVLHTSNGHIQANRVSGPIDATSSNGSITLEFEGSPKNDVHASTSNSSITLRMPPQTAARVRASTSNASISTDFDVTMQGEISKNHINGTIGGGGPLLDLSSSNGGIHIERR